MTAPLRLLTAALVLAAPLVASAAPGGSDLDRLSETGAVLRSEVQPEAPGPLDEFAPPPGPPPDAAPVPLDGGLSLLALAGAGYAARRLRARRTRRA